MIGDGKTHYDHDFDGTSAEAGGCSLEFRNKPEPVSVRITHVNKKFFKVFVVDLARVQSCC